MSNLRGYLINPYGILQLPDIDFWNGLSGCPDLERPDREMRYSHQFIEVYIAGKWQMVMHSPLASWLYCYKSFELSPWHNLSCICKVFATQTAPNNLLKHFIAMSDKWWFDIDTDIEIWEFKKIRIMIYRQIVNFLNHSFNSVDLFFVFFIVTKIHTEHGFTVSKLPQT